MKSFIIILTLLFLSIIFSHSFFPFSFSISAPSELKVSINQEVNIFLTIKNTGMLGDSYNVYISSQDLDVKVFPTQEFVSLESQSSTSIPIKIIVYSTLNQNRKIEIKVCSLGLLNSYNQQELIDNCSYEECKLSEGKNCMRKEISIKTVSTFSLGNFSLYSFIITLLFSIIFAILLSYLLNKRQKPFYGRRH